MPNIYSYEEKFKKTQDLLLGAFSTYYSWKSLQVPENQNIYNVNNDFWSVTIPALQHEWFLGLARIFEDSSYTRNGQVLSVYSLITNHPDNVRKQQAQDFLDKNKKVLTNIERVRDHFHAHNNLDALMNPKEFELRFSIKYDEIEEIFQFADKLLGILHPEDGHGFVLDHLKEEAEKDTQDVITGLKYFNKKRKDHYQSWTYNSTNIHDFPSEEDTVF